MAKGSRGGKRHNTFDDGGGAPTNDKTTYDLPSRMNKMYNGNKMSKGHTLDTFANSHKNSPSEHAVIFDDDGFVSTYKHGNEHSVTFYKGELTGKNITHNHPSGSHFSQADLTTMASEKAKSITADPRGKNGRYTLTATSKADYEGFKNAVLNAKTTIDTSTMDGYNKAVDTFLKNNAKKYGFEYSNTVK